MKSIENKKIAIIGGGPGGLTLARLLQMNGAEVKVYERDVNKDARVQGATLDLHHESGLKALQEAGLMEAFKNYYRPGADRIRIANKEATILVDQQHQDSGNFGDEHFRPEIDRGPLRKLLLESINENSIIWNSQFKSMSPQGEGWNIEFHNGHTAYADLVIAADGANSKLRPILTPIKAFYAGLTIVEGSVHDSEIRSPKIHQLLNGGKIFAMSDEKSIIVSSKGDGSFVFYAGYKTNENWVRTCGIDFNNKAQVVNWFKKEFSDWNAVWNEMFENADSEFTARQINCMPLDQQWEAQSNLTILGDAAHLMPPYAGEGVNMAMLDALELSQCLLNEKYLDTKSAIAAYEKQMLARASEVAKISLDQTVALHAPGAIEHLINVMNGN